MKKRYMLTLTQETVEKIQSDLKAIGLPKPAMSALVDDWLLAFSPTLSKMADRKRRGEQLTFEEVLGDLFNQIGSAMKS